MTEVKIEEKSIFEDETPTSTGKEIETLITKEELSQLEEFKKILEKDYPEEVKDSNEIWRFLKARKMNFKDAESMYRSRREWFGEFKPDSLNEKEFPDEIAFGKIFIYGFDKHKRPVIIIKAARHWPNAETLEDSWKLFVYVVRKAEKLLPPPPYNQFMAIYDREGYQRSNFDLALIKRMVSIGDYYPELLGKIFILHANWLFNILYAIAGAFIDPVTKAKIHLADAKELQAYIDTDNLLPEHLGKEVNEKLKFPTSTPLYPKKK
eukprot:gene10287-2704_t